MVLEKLKMLEQAEIILITIPSTSYVIKYFISEILKRKIETLKEKQLLFPSKRTQYGSIEFCFNNTILESTPYKLFKLYNCCALRVHHIDGKLYLQVTTFVRRFSSANLERIIKILGNKLETKQLVGLPVSILSKEIKERFGYITKVLDTDNSQKLRFIIKTQRGDFETEAKDLMLNCTFTKARTFISKIVGENLDEFERQRYYLTVKDPLSKLEEIKSAISKIQELFFPIRLESIQFSLSSNPMNVEISEQTI